MRWIVGPSLLLLVAVGVLTWTQIGPANDAPYIAPVPTEPAATAIDAGGAAEALQRLASAVLKGDRAAAVALAGPNRTTAAQLSDLVDVGEAARIENVTLRYIDEEGGLAADGTWAATVDATWAYAGFDTKPTSTEVLVRFVPFAGEVVIASLGGGGLRTPVWMSGPMQVSRSAELLVVAAASTDLEAYVRLANSAVPTVSSVIRTWRPRLVIEVPADGAALEAALGTEPGYYAQIAAVTGSGGALVSTSPIHVFVNPDVFAGLGRAGREVVLAHEAAHVATEAPFSKAPTWLIEGFADYVALRRTRLPIKRTAGQIAAQIRDQGLPEQMPSTADFDTRGPHLGAVYEASWLACVVLAERAGPAQLSAFYSEVSAGEPVSAALKRYFAWSEEDHEEAWRALLETVTA